MNIKLDVKLKQFPGKSVKGNIPFVDDNVKIYFNGQHLYVQLSSIERSFFDYLCEQMRTDTNQIMVTQGLKEKYIDHIFSIASKKVAVGTLSNYSSKLISLNLIIRLTGKEYYLVNPKYAFKGSEAARRRLLKKLLTDSKAKVESLQPLLNLPIEKFVETKSSK